MTCFTEVIEERPILTIIEDGGSVEFREDVSPLVIAEGGPQGAPGGVSSVNTRTGAVVLTSADVGLGSVNNTSDASKPVSTAQAAADAAVLAASFYNSDGTLSGSRTVSNPFGFTVSGAGAFTFTSGTQARFGTSGNFITANSVTGISAINSTFLNLESYDSTITGITALRIRTSRVNDGAAVAGETLISSDTNGLAEWAMRGFVPAGGTTGQALVKTSGTNYATAWQTITTVTAGTLTGTTLAANVTASSLTSAAGGTFGTAAFTAASAYASASHTHSPANITGGTASTLAAFNSSGVLVSYSGVVVDQVNGRVGIGVTPTQRLDVRQDVNGNAIVQLVNANAGNVAQAVFVTGNGTDSSNYGTTGTGYSGYGVLPGRCAYLYSTRGMCFMSDFASGFFRWAGSGGAQVLELTIGGKFQFNTTTTAAGTTGNRTINQPSGTVNIAAGGTTVTVTNSMCLATSIVMPVLRTNDATAAIKNCVPSAGSFAINLTAAATAEVSIGWIVYN